MNNQTYDTHSLRKQVSLMKKVNGVVCYYIAKTGLRLRQILHTLEEL